jgi:unsaturated rhamnogalacturonyl hydrolase
MKLITKIRHTGLLLLCLLALSAHKGNDNNPQSAPAVLDKKEITKCMLKAMKWQESNPIQAKAPTDWTNGAYYTGVARAHQATGKKKFKKALQEMGVRNDWQPYNRFYHADDLAISYSYLYLQSLGAEKVDLSPTKQFIEEHLYKPHAWREGIPDQDQRTLWWWCDALFMAPPVITYYSDLKDQNTYLNDMHQYYKQTYELLYDQEEQLFARDVRFLWDGDGNDMKEANGEKIFWSRGNGWVLGGLALMLDNLPKDYEHRPFYVELFKTMAARIKELQPEDGLWRTSLLNPEAYEHGEVSGSGFYVFALAWGVNNGILDAAEYTPAIRKGWQALEACQHDNGMVGWVQNIGASPEPASADSWQNYGTGAFLLAGSEMLKLQE